jgi:hypothetical protein
VLDGAAEKPDGGDRFLVGEDLDVGQTGGVVDRDVDVFPADDIADPALGVDALAGVVPALAVGDPLASAALDPSELLDVDVDQLPGTSSFIALSGLQAEPAELAHTDPGEDPGHG